MPVAAVVLAAGAFASASSGITGSFRLTVAKVLKGSDQHTIVAKMEGKFWSCGKSCAAETAYPFPGGGTEKVCILLIEDGNKLLLLYPETMNYRRIQLSDESKALLKTVSPAIGTSFAATPEMFANSGFSLEPLGRQDVEGESLLAYRLKLPDGKEPAVKGTSGQEWKLRLYFMPNHRRLRMMRVCTPELDLRLFISGVKQSELDDDVFNVPIGYYELKPEGRLKGLR